VKSLANKTAMATDDIANKIEQIQTNIQEGVSTIKRIVMAINQIHESQNIISTAIEEQSVTTNEIGRVVAKAAHSSQDIMLTISETTKIAEQTKAGAINTQQSAEELDSMALALKEMLSQFKTSQKEE
jgi:methyl-accepting chemotaxis protein